MRTIVESFPRHGSERTHQVSTGPDAWRAWQVNFKRVHPILKQEAGRSGRRGGDSSGEVAAMNVIGIEGFGRKSAVVKPMAEVVV